jgi:hypothetical protein
MKARLIKDEDGYSLFTKEENSTNRKCIASTSGMYVEYKLSKQNCDDLFSVVDINKFIREDSMDQIIYNESYELGFKKAMELNKDKVFTEEDVRKAYIYGVSNCHSFGHSAIDYTDKCIQSLQQPTEIEVEVEMVCPHPMDTYRCGLEYSCDEDGCNHPNQIPYLDSNGCLILKKK